MMYVAKTHRLRCFAALSMTVARLGGEWSNGLSLRDVEILRRTLSVRLRMTACCWPRFLHPFWRQFLPLGIHRFDESNLLGSQPPFDLLLSRDCVTYIPKFLEIDDPMSSSSSSDAAETFTKA